MSELSPLRIVAFNTQNPARQAELRAGAVLAAAPRTVELRCPRDAAELIGSLADSEIMLSWQFTPEMFRAAPNLRWLHLSGAGANHVLFPEMLASNIALTNTRGIHGAFMAEWCAAALFHIAQQFQHLSEWRTTREWKPPKDAIQRSRFLLRGKSAIIVGHGSVGTEIAETLRGIGLHTEGITSAQHHQLSTRIGFYDIVIIALPLTAQTEHLFNESLLSKMKTGAILVNVARGKIIDEAALVRALQNGTLAYAALDVFAQEPLAADSVLFGLPNVFMTPHVSGNYPAYTADVIEVFLANLKKYVKNEPLDFEINKQRGY